MNLMSSMTRVLGLESNFSEIHGNEVYARGAEGNLIINFDTRMVGNVELNREESCVIVRSKIKGKISQASETV